MPWLLGRNACSASGAAPLATPHIMSETPAPPPQTQREVRGQQEVQGYPRSLVFNYLLFASLGMVCSLLWHSYYGVGPGENLEQLLILSTHTNMYTLEEVKAVLQGTNCEDVEREAKIPFRLMNRMGTKLRYQFNPIVENSESIEHCRAIKVLWEGHAAKEGWGYRLWKSWFRHWSHPFFHCRCTD